MYGDNETENSGLVGRTNPRKPVTRITARGTVNPVCTGPTTESPGTGLPPIRHEGRHGSTPTPHRTPKHPVAGVEWVVSKLSTSRQFKRGSTQQTPSDGRVSPPSRLLYPSSDTSGVVACINERPGRISRTTGDRLSTFLPILGRMLLVITVNSRKGRAENTLPPSEKRKHQP